MKQSRNKAQAVSQIDNEQVIVTEWIFEIGTETGWHNHKYDYVVVPQMNGELLIESENEQVIKKLNVGKSYFNFVGVEHNVINNNDFEFVFIEIELR